MNIQNNIYSTPQSSLGTQSSPNKLKYKQAINVFAKALVIFWVITIILTIVAFSVSANCSKGVMAFEGCTYQGRNISGYINQLMWLSIVGPFLYSMLIAFLCLIGTILSLINNFVRRRI